jgi:hypothetical protein
MIQIIARLTLKDKKSSLPFGYHQGIQGLGVTRPRWDGRPLTDVLCLLRYHNLLQASAQEKVGIGA